VTLLFCPNLAAQRRNHLPPEPPEANATSSRCSLPHLETI
jgi:hypothetical protein